MKAIVHAEYGSPDVLQVREVATPVPKDREILIKVHATTATSSRPAEPMTSSSTASARLRLPAATVR